jgi:hypothetical protein
VILCRCNGQGTVYLQKGKLQKGGCLPYYYRITPTGCGLWASLWYKG